MNCILSKSVIFLKVRIAFIFLCLSTVAICQPDDEWKKQNDRGNRYEGRVSLEIGAPPIELIGFYGFREKFETGTNESLRVRFYLHDTLQVYLCAQEIERKEFYWMEAKPQKWQIGWNEFGPWPSGEVISKLNLPANNIGVLVRSEKVYGSGPVSPAILYYSAPPQTITEYTAYFRPGKALASGRYELYRDCKESDLIKKGRIGRQSAGVPFVIRFALPEEWEGLVKLRVTVKVKGEITPVPPLREYCFYHSAYYNKTKK